MPRDYQQLSLEERDEIIVMSWEGKSLRQIAQAMGRAPKEGLPPPKLKCCTEKGTAILGLFSWCATKNLTIKGAFLEQGI